MQLPPSEHSFSLKSILPSSTVSLCVHLLFLVMVGISLRGCDKGVAVEAGGQEYREVGLASLTDESENRTDIQSQNPQDSDEVRPSEDSAETSTRPTDVPNVSELLGHDNSLFENNRETNSSTEMPSVIGPGTPIGGFPKGGGLPELIRPEGKSGLGASGSPTPGHGDTSFMNIAANGDSFVYVIDTSSSMKNYDRLNLAKSHLKSSLRMLQPHQSFRVLFYNDEVMPMNLRQRDTQRMYAATTANIRLAVDRINSTLSMGGTKHLNPILRALFLEPDVIYFLTDGTEPVLTSGNLTEIRHRNRSAAQIHVIEFASGPRESLDESWLELLARQSRGRYVRVGPDSMRQ